MSQKQKWVILNICDMAFIDEMKEATDGRYPEFALWENVPGALSSAGGHDFQAVLEAFAKGEVPMPGSGRWADAGMVRGGRADIAWVVYDAQYFGTAQRRRRVFLVADFSGRRSGEVLFVPKSLRRYFEEGGTPRQGLAAYAEDGPGGAGGAVPMAARGADGGAIYCIAGNIIGRQNHNGGNGMGFQEGISYTLTAMDRHAVSVPAVTMRIRSGCDGGGKGALLQIERSGTLATGNDQYLFEPGTGALEVQGGGPLASWPAAEEAGANGTATGQGNVGYRVRRLMPLECERLQGFPDHWTAWGHGGRQISDSKRYQMLGNSIAVPCAAYIMQGICQALGGIGGPSMSAMQGLVLI